MKSLIFRKYVKGSLIYKKHLVTLTITDNYAAFQERLMYNTFNSIMSNIYDAFTFKIKRFHKQVRLKLTNRFMLYCNIEKFKHFC